jgi:hypothetical protein
VNQAGEVQFSVQLGVFLLAGVMGWLSMLLFKRRSRAEDKAFRLSMFFGLVFFAATFMTTPASWPVWRSVEVFQTMQFPWRWLNIATFAGVFCTAYYADQLLLCKRWLTAPLILLAIGSNYQFAKVDKYYPWTDPALNSGGYRGTFTLLLEETPIWHSPFDEYNQLHKYQLTKTEKGDFTVSEVAKKTNYHQLEVVTPEGGVLSVKTHYWPGWKVYIDKKRADLYPPSHPYSHGLLTFDVEPGKHLIEVKLTEPLELQIANTVSLISVTIVGIILPGQKGRWIKS